MKIDGIELKKFEAFKYRNAKIYGDRVRYFSIIVFPFCYPDEILVFRDGKQVPFEKKLFEGDLKVETLAPKNFKSITVAIKHDGQYYEIYTMANAFGIKLKRSVHSSLKKVQNVGITAGKGIKYFWKEYRLLVPPAMWKKWIDHFNERVKYRNRLILNPNKPSDYRRWAWNNENIYGEDISDIDAPLISMINLGKDDETVKSMLDKQNYKNFEFLNITDIRNAKGDYLCFIDENDFLEERAVAVYARSIASDKNVKIIYCDEDELDDEGLRCNPDFKPDYSPDALLGFNYFGHFVLIERQLVEASGYLDLSMEDFMDYDLYLKCVEKIEDEDILHIQEMLIHRIPRKEISTEKGKLAIEKTLVRRGTKGSVDQINGNDGYCVTYDTVDDPLVSIIIPTRDYADVTERCLESIYEKTTYKNFEILLMNNNSIMKETLDLFNRYQRAYSNFHVIQADMEFNYSAINNLGVEHAKGDILILLNNDTEVITPNWIEQLAGYAMQPHIGAVGAKLLYPDNTVQHAGVVCGFGGVGAHAFAGEDKDIDGMGMRLKVPYNYQAVTAACLAIEKRKFEQVDGLEETLKVANNDVDFCFKLDDCGYLNVCLNQVMLIHHESKTRGFDTTSEKYKRFKIETDYMLNKWDKYISYDKYYNNNLSQVQTFYLDGD